jgi:hypothetical protein
MQTIIKSKPAWKPTLGAFSKAKPGSIALNFSESGGENCSLECEALKNNVCYAVQVEKKKLSVQTSGERKRKLGFEALCKAYKRAIERKTESGEIIPWIRFSAFGSVPNRPLTAPEVQAFVDLVRAFPPCTPVHFPVETREKAERFRALSFAFDLPLVVRESCQSDARAKECLEKGLPSSRIVYEGSTKRERLANAIAYAKQTPGATVCPAIASTILKRDHKVKCGECKLCAIGSRTLILYPQH